MMDELERKVAQHWTAAEFIDFLDIKVEDIFARFDDVIEMRYGEIAGEVCFEFEEVE